MTNNNDNDYDYDYDLDDDYEVKESSVNVNKSTVQKKRPVQSQQPQPQHKATSSNGKPVKYDKKGRIKKKDSTLAIIADALVLVVFILPIPKIISWLMALAAIILAIIDLATVKGEEYRHLGSIVAIVIGVISIFGMFL